MTRRIYELQLQVPIGFHGGLGVRVARGGAGLGMFASFLFTIPQQHLFLDQLLPVRIVNIESYTDHMLIGV